VSGCYDGLLKNGNYTIWKPTGSFDTEWRYFNQNWDFEHPYSTVTYTNANNTSGSQSLRIRIAGRWELQALTNLLNKQPSRVDPEEVEFTLKVLQGFPHTVENSFHLSSIGNFFKSAFGAAKRIIPALAPSIGAAASAFGHPEIGGAIGGLGNLIGSL